jgi:hypothetical protein
MCYVQCNIVYGGATNKWCCNLVSIRPWLWAVCREYTNKRVEVDHWLQIESSDRVHWKPKIALWRIRGEEVVRDMQTQCIPRTRQFGSGPEHLLYDELNGLIVCADCEMYVPPLLYYYCLSWDKQDLMDELTTVTGNSKVSAPANFLYTDEKSPK